MVILPDAGKLELTEIGNRKLISRLFLFNKRLKGFQ